MQLHLIFHLLSYMYNQALHLKTNKAKISLTAPVFPITLRPLIIFLEPFKQEFELNNYNCCAESPSANSP